MIALSTTVATDGQPLTLDYVPETGMLYLGMPLPGSAIVPVAELSLANLLAALAEVTS